MTNVTAKETPAIDGRLSRVQQGVATEVKALVDGTGRIVLLDFTVGFLFIFRSVSLFSLPLATIVLLLYVVFRSFKKTDYSVRCSGAVIAVFLVGAVYLLIVSVFVQEIDLQTYLQRMVRILAIVFFALLIADRRIDIRSLLLGFGVGLLFNATGFYAGIAPADYGEYLTGWIQDKNVAGLYHAVVSLLLFVFFTKTWQRTMIIVLALPLLWETGSRTSIGAFIIAMGWVLLARKISIVWKMVLGGAVMWLFEWAQTNFASSEVFGDRTGTDWFREQIDTAAWAKVQATPWYGQGLGEATVVFDNGSGQYFHNSFWTLFVEGGWPWLLAVLAITLVVVFFVRQENNSRRIGAEAAMVLLFVCSWRLGEVLLTMPWGLAFGLALYYLSENKQTRLYRTAYSR